MLIKRGEGSIINVIKDDNELINDENIKKTFDTSDKKNKNSNNTESNKDLEN